MPPCTSRDVRPLVPPARSPFSKRMVRSPRRAASRAMPAPWIPPPITTRSYRPKLGISVASRRRRFGAEATACGGKGLLVEGFLLLPALPPQTRFEPNRESGERDADECPTQDVGRKVPPEEHAARADPERDRPGQETQPPVTSAHHPGKAERRRRVGGRKRGIARVRVVVRALAAEDALQHLDAP